MIDCTETLGQVKALGRSNRATLGFLPEGAFDQACHKGRILVAIDGERALGYLLYRVTGNQAKITHLCVEESCRKNRVAAELLQLLQKEVKHLEAISLLCRRDFEAHGVWPRLGFAPIAEKPGRGRDRKLLTLWQLTIRPPSLFTLAFEKEAAGKLTAAIDANIFFDLFSDDAESEESKSLVADWISDSLSLVVTDELLIEINRAPTQEMRDRNRRLFRTFRSLETDPREVFRRPPRNLFYLACGCRFPARPVGSATAGPSCQWPSRFFRFA